MGMTRREKQGKDFIIKRLSQYGYPTYADIFRYFDFNLTQDPNVIGYMQPAKGRIVMNSHLDMKAVSVVIRHEILHFYLKHERRLIKKIAKKFGFDPNEMTLEQLENVKREIYKNKNFNIAGDYEISNRGYTEEDKENIRNIELDGRILSGLVTEDDHPDWIDWSLEDMYDALNNMKKDTPPPEQNNNQNNDSDSQDSSGGDDSGSDTSDSSNNQDGSNQSDSDNSSDGDSNGDGSDSSSNSDSDDDSNETDDTGGGSTSSSGGSTMDSDDSQDSSSSSSSNKNDSESSKDSDSSPQIGDTGSEDIQKEEEEKRKEQIKKDKDNYGDYLDDEEKDDEEDNDSSNSSNTGKDGESSNDSTESNAKLDKIKKLLQDPDVADKIEKETEANVLRSKQKKFSKQAAKNAQSYKTDPSVARFEASLKRFIKNQISNTRETTWKRFNKTYSGTGIMRPGHGTVKNKNVPVVNVYFDRSGSWGPDKSAVGMKAIQSLNNYVRQKKLQVQLYYFNTDIMENDPGMGRGGTRGTPIINHIKQTNPDNVIVMTDDDIGDCSESVTVPGAVWFLWKGGISDNLQQHLHGKQETSNYTLE